MGSLLKQFHVADVLLQWKTLFASQMIDTTKQAERGFDGPQPIIKISANVPSVRYYGGVTAIIVVL